MKNFMLASLLLAAASATHAQTAPAKPATAASINVTRAQVVADVDAAFARVDANKDGFISIDEASAAQARVAAHQAAALAQRAEQEFTRLDADNNGQLSRAEFKKAFNSVQVVPGDKILAMLDANKDGKVTLGEFQAQRLAKFDATDANHDGIVTAQEQQTAGPAPR